MFSKAKLKRFNELIGCAPPSTKYDPKTSSSQAGAFSLPKSERFLELKCAAPGPNQYQATPCLLSTPVPSTPRSLGPRRTKLIGSVSSVHSARTNKTEASECASQISEDLTTASEMATLREEVKQLRAANVSLHSELQQLHLATAPGLIAANVTDSSADTELLTQVLQLLDCAEQLDSRLSAAEQLQGALVSRELLVQRLDSVCEQLQRLDSVTEQWSGRLEQHEMLAEQVRVRCDQQSVHVKELELLVQVARESEVVAHDTCCSLQHRLEMLHGDTAGDRQRLTTLQHQHDQLSCRLYVARDQHVAMTQQLGDAEQEALLMIDRADRLESEVSRLRRENDALSVRAVSSEQLLAACESRLELVAASLQQAEVRLEGSEAERGEAELRVSAVEGHLAAAGQERDELQRQLATAHEQLSSGDSERQLLMSEMWYTALHDRLMDEEGQQLRKQLSERQQTIEQLRQAQAEKQGELDEALVVCRSERCQAMDWREQLQLASDQAERACGLLVERERLVQLLEQQVSELKEHAVLVTRELGAVSGRLSAAETACCEKDDCLAAMRVQADTLTEQLSAERHAASAARARAASLVESESATRAEVERLTLSEADARAEVARMADELVETTACADEQIEVRCRLQEEVRELQQRLGSEAAAMATKERMMRQMHDDLTALAQNRDHLRESVESLEAECERLRREDCERSAVVDQLRAKCVRQESVCVERDADIAQLSVKCDQLQSECEQRNSEFSQLQRQCTDLQRTCDELNETIVQVGTIRDKLQVCCDERDTDISELRAKCDALRQFCDEREAVVGDLRDNCERLEKQCSKNTARYTALGSEYNELQQVCEERGRKVNELRDQCDELQRVCVERDAVVADLERVREERDVSVTQLTAAATAVDRLTQELAARAADRCDQLNMLRAQLVEADTERLQAEQQLSEAVKRTKEADEQRALAQNQLQEREQQLELVKQQHDKDLESLYDKFADMRARLRASADVEKQLADAQAELQRVRESVTAAEHNRQQLKLQLQRQQSAVDYKTAAEWKSMYDSLVALVGPFQSELQQFQSERDCLLAQRDDTRAEIQQLSVQYSQLLGHQNKKQKLHHIMKLKEENLKLKTRVADLEKDLCKQRAKLRMKQDDRSSTLFSATLSSRAKSKSSHDFSRSIADLTELKENLSMAAVTPLRETCRNRVNLSPLTATPPSMYKSPRHLEYP